MKCRILAVCAVCVLLGAVLFSQIHTADGAQNTPPAVVSPSESENAYGFSFTATRWLNEEDPEAIVCTYDLQSGAVSEHFQFPVSAMYALGIYDQASDTVFYSRELDNNTYERWHNGDQIYRHDLTTGADEALTDNLLAVNYLHPVNDALLFLAATLEKPDSLVVGRIDLLNGEIRYWDEVDTASTRLLSLDRERERLYVAMYDSNEDTVFYGANGVRPTHTIYSYDYQLDDKREILCETHKKIRSIYVNDGLLMYCIENEETGVPQTYTTRVIDTDTMEVLFENRERFSQEGCLAPDGAGAYSFVTIGDFNGIGYFDFETQSYIPVLEYSPAESNEPADIVNFQMLRVAE